MSVWRSSAFLIAINCKFSMLLLIVTLKIMPCYCRDVETIWAMHGESTVIPCNVTATDPDDNMTLVLWYKDSSDDPLYGLDLRVNDGNDKPEHYFSNVVSNRAYFNMKSDPAGLEINRLSPSDTGLYKCRVDFHKARTVKQDTFLQIIVPPKKPIIENEDGEEVSGMIGPYNEGDSLKLVCESDYGIPTTKLKWWRENSLLQSTENVIVRETSLADVITSVLFIDNLTPDFLHVVISCEAVNNNISKAPSSTVRIDMNFEPRSVEIKSTKKVLSAGKPIKMVCMTSGSRPPAVLNWYVSGKKISGGDTIISEDGHSTTSFLTFTPSSVHNGQTLACRATNPLITKNLDSTLPSSVGNLRQNGGKFDHFLLNVKFAPEVTLVVEGNESTTKEGDDVTMNCRVKANPPTNKIHWTFEGQPINSKSSLNEFLILRNVSKSDSGIYRCFATNKQGSSASNVIKLRVKYAPICDVTVKFRREFGVSKDEAAQVHCFVKSDPPNVSFHWAFNNSIKEQVSLDSYISSDSSSTLTYVPTTVPDDYGQLLCWASNSIGIQRQPCVFKIFVAEAPSSLVNCKISNVTTSSVDLRCEPGSDGGLAQIFITEVYDKLSHTLRANVSSKHPVFHIPHLQSDLSFMFVIYAANAKGRSRSIALHTRTTSTDEKPTFDLTIVFGILFGLVIMLVIFGLVAIVIVKYCRRRNMSKNVKKNFSSESSSSSQMSPKEVIKEIECDFYEIKNPDIIPSRNSASDSGYSELTVDELTSGAKKANNVIIDHMCNQQQPNNQIRRHKNNLKFNQQQISNLISHEEEDPSDIPEDNLTNESISIVSRSDDLMRSNLDIEDCNLGPRIGRRNPSRINSSGVNVMTPLLENVSSTIVSHAESAV